MGRSDAAIRRCLQERVDNGRFQRHDGSGQPRASVDQEDRFIFSCSNRAEWGRIVFSDESRFHLCSDDNRNVSGDDQGSVPILISLLHVTLAFNKELFSVAPFLLNLDHFGRHWRHTYSTPQDNAKPHTIRVAMSCLTAYQTLPWPARSPDPSPIKRVWDMMRSYTKATGEGLRSFETGSGDEDVARVSTLFSKLPLHVNLRTLSFDRFKVHQNTLHG
ncbi:transposable element Tc1 transposase [Trichonephila clavipes]|nr:transposable element Tc1 transposase [Trichonephila clavipes]